ncbi:protein of unknown function [Dyadobacter koreensis]|uniref:DUF4133 domain-containing protein n=1 Tax=Dyadobacter koreensis TaxID=408657 RepID=A0A1H7B8F7_9BACT|nr:DUF4133 domain-containing protein [Dyadobacter koreensis]SEJ69685.1 protein of unknown function [Dyadobacter koreensis]
MEELLTADYHPYLYLDNPEILIKDPLIYSRPRSLKKKVKKTCDRIREMIALGQPQQEIIDQSVELITSELRPSRFGYVCAVIASEFPKTFLKWVKINELTDQVLDVLSACEPVFSLLKFNSYTAEQHSIYITISNFIRHYLKRKKRNSAPQPREHTAGKRTASAVVTEPETAAIPFPVTIPVPAVKQVPPLKTVTYFQSELLENSAHSSGRIRSHTNRLPSGAIVKPIEEIEIMSNKQYPINKGINKSLVFKGLKAQYIGYMGLGLLIDLLFYAVLYTLKVNTYITLLLTLALGALIAVIVYHLNAQYGEHGLIKAMAKRKTPKIIRSFSRRIFQ